MMGTEDKTWLNLRGRTHTRSWQSIQSLKMPVTRWPCKRLFLEQTRPSGPTLRCRTSRLVALLSRCWSHRTDACCARTQETPAPSWCPKGWPSPSPSTTNPQTKASPLGSCRLVGLYNLGE
eukprot:Lithocolla_globosa_v1_NODE_6129_length_1129_cov_192.183844.p3 type:complete len:121 gc:universal NODE_6129_length_1129_cov_192.183844:321-683(+)